MTFTSSLFIIGVLPWILSLSRLFGNNIRNKKFLLIFANIIFYLYSGIKGLGVLVGIVFLCYLFYEINNRINNKIILFLECFIMLIPLGIFKFSTISSLFIPLGISFFTFEAISFLVDNYRTRVEEISLFDLLIYLTFFPTITSGPILRYREFNYYLYTRQNYEDYHTYIERIALGIIKKTLVADKLAILANYYFNGIADGKSFSCVGLWIGSISYTLQIYYDFSGYSDMAIGIGGALGFVIPENFNNPYQASSISDFWKRWHISLTKWFTDYIYIPLGGNRCSIKKHIFNLGVVWLITGIWHGRDFSFIVWGLSYFILQLLEKYGKRMNNMSEKWYGHLYTLFWINLLWIYFRASNIFVANKYIAGMFNIFNPKIIEDKAVYYLPLLSLATIVCFPWSGIIKKIDDNKIYIVTKGIIIIVLLFFSICAISNATYTPYIYGTF